MSALSSFFHYVDEHAESATLYVTLLTALITDIITRLRDRKESRQETYKELEMASIDLFRFEADHPELMIPIWQDKRQIPHKRKERAKYIIVMNYVCQMLNLFELSIKFRKNKVMPEDVFGSWVAWFYLLVSAPGFQVIWQDIKDDYVSELRHIMQKGVELATDDSIKNKKQQFYEFVGEQLNCHIVLEWLEEEEEEETSDVAPSITVST